MVLMSDQHYVSRGSMLFSMFDFNSSGSVNRAEFFIAVRSLLRGLSCFFKLTPPTKEDMEKLTFEVFDKMDEDKSDLILLGESLTYIYRSKEFRMLTGLFVSRNR